MNGQLRYLYYLVAMTLSGVLFLSLIWEFFLEDRVVPHIYEYHHSEPLYERVEYVVTVLILVAISLVIPIRLALRNLQHAEEAKRALSTAYQDLEKRVEDRTRQLLDANEQLERALTERKQSENALRESEREYRLLSSQLLTALENERRRIALDLHDNVTQALIAMKLRIEKILSDVDGGTTSATQLHGMLIPLIQDSVAEVRNMYMRLRPSILDELGLFPALTWLWREFQEAHPEIRLSNQVDFANSDVDDNLKVVIYRVVQEALDNIARHSQAKEIFVALTVENDTIRVTVKDDGKGFRLEEVMSVDDSLRGMGLSGMRERVQLVGGTLRIESEPGSGTEISASLPIRRASA